MSPGKSVWIYRVWLIRLVFLVFALFAWELFSRLGFVSSYFLPPPSEILLALVDMAKKDLLWESIARSMSRMLIGYGISVIIGSSIGFVLAGNSIFKLTFGSLVAALQSVPSICWLPFALLWIGIDERAIIAVVVLGATFSIATATENAVRNVPPIYLKVGQVLGAKGFVLAKDILFFAALPEWLGGMKLGWSFAWRSLMAAELIRQDALGIGRLLEIGRAFSDVPMMLAAMVVILTVGSTVDSLIFGTLERKVRTVYGLDR